MSRDTDNLERLVCKLQVRYGPHDALVCELRDELQRRQSHGKQTPNPLTVRHAGTMSAAPARSPSLAAPSGMQ